VRLLWKPLLGKKNMWRADYLVCPSICTEDTPLAECKCTCPELTEWLENQQSHEILAIIGPLFKGENAAIYLQNENGEDKSVELLKLLCNAYENFNPVIGDSLESASPVDISFWPTHPTVERLFIWRRINGFENEIWVDNSASSVNGISVGYCWGHNSQDLTIWKNMFDDSDEYYTNAQLYAFTSPENEEFPYIFDNFRWPHCVNEGYSLDLLSETKSPKNELSQPIPITN